MDFEFQVLDSLSLKLGIRMPIVTGTSDSLTHIPDFKAQESGSHNSNFPDSKIQRPKIFRIPKAKFPGFRIPQTKISRIPDSKSKSFPDSRFQNQKSKISRIPDSTSKSFPDSLTSGYQWDETESNLVPSM